MFLVKPLGRPLLWLITKTVTQYLSRFNVRVEIKFGSERFCCVSEYVFSVNMTPLGIYLNHSRPRLHFYYEIPCLFDYVVCEREREFR